MDPRTLTAVRVGVSVLVAALIGFVAHLDDPFWATISVFLVAGAHLEISLAKGVMRMVAAICGAMSAVAIASITSNSQVGMVIGIFFVTAIGTYGSLDGKWPAAWQMGAATFFIVAVTSAVFPDQVFYTAFWRCIEIPVGIIVLLVFGFLLFPRRAEEELIPVIHQLQRDLQLELQSVVEGFTMGCPAQVDKLIDSIRLNLKKADGLVEAMRLIGRHLGLQSELAAALVDELRRIHHSTSAMAVVCQGRCAPPLEGLELQETLEAICPLFYQTDLIGGQTPESTHRVHQLLQQVRKAFDQHRHAGSTEEFELDDVLAYHATLSGLEEICAALHEIEILEGKGRHYVEPKPQKAWFLRPLKRELVIHCGKTGLACVITFYLWLLSNWYMGKVGLIAALAIGLERNIYYTWNRARQRIGGAIVGATFGICALAFFVQDVFSLSIALLIGATLFGYIAAGPPRMSTFGQQAGLGLSMALVAKDTMLSSVDMPMQRLGGVVIGTLVATLVNMFILPVRAKDELRAGLANNFNLLADLLEGGDPAALKPKIIAQHKTNHEIARALNKERLFRLQVNVLISVFAIQRHVDWETAIRALQPICNVEDLLSDMCQNLRQLSQAVRIKEPTNLAPMPFGDYLHKIRGSGLRMLPSQETGKGIMLLAYFQDLHDSLNQVVQIINELALPSQIEPALSNSASRL